MTTTTSWQLFPMDRVWKANRELLRGLGLKKENEHLLDAYYKENCWPKAHSWSECKGGGGLRRRHSASPNASSKSWNTQERSGGALCNRIASRKRHHSSANAVVGSPKYHFQRAGCVYDSSDLNWNDAKEYSKLCMSSSWRQFPLNNNYNRRSNKRYGFKCYSSTLVEDGCDMFGNTLDDLAVEHCGGGGDCLLTDTCASCMEIILQR